MRRKTPRLDLLNAYSHDIKIIAFQAKEAKGPRIRNPKDFAKRFADIAYWDREAFLVVTMNQKNRVIDKHLVSLGTLTSTLVHPREVYKPAILDSAASVVFLHNHPSGDPKPSDEDKMLTTQLHTAGTYLGIELIDHIIIGRDGYFSFADKGWLGSKKTD